MPRKKDEGKHKKHSRSRSHTKHSPSSSRSRSSERHRRHHDTNHSHSRSHNKSSKHHHSRSPSDQKGKNSNYPDMYANPAAMPYSYYQNPYYPFPHFPADPYSGRGEEGGQNKDYGGQSTQYPFLNSSIDYAEMASKWGYGGGRRPMAGKPYMPMMNPYVTDLCGKKMIELADGNAGCISAADEDGGRGRQGGI